MNTLGEALGALGVLVLALSEALGDALGLALGEALGVALGLALGEVLGVALRDALELKLDKS